MTKEPWLKSHPLPPVDPRDLVDFEGWFKARKARAEKLHPPPWLIVKRFDDPDDKAAVAAVFALHVADDQPWLVRGVLRTSEEGPLMLARLSVEHLNDPAVELTTTAMRLPVSTIRDRANAWLRYRDIGLPVLDTIGAPRTPAERRWDRKVAAEANKPPKRGRQGNAAEHYRPIALRAIEIFGSGRRDVVKALHEELDMPYQTVRDWIGRAREFGLLAPVDQGRTNFHPGPNLYPKEDEDG